jgi:hypothetical protein
MPHAQPQRLDTRLSVSVACARSRLASSLAWTLALGLASLLATAGPAAATRPAKAASKSAKAAPPAATVPPTASAVPTAPRIQKLVNELRRSLSVTHDVTVELVADNPLKASVEPVKGSGNRFRLAIDRRFLEQLSPDELRAVVAHELGHVWIYTHFPYLQTEQLANQIAMRVVTRESLFLVYGKVWADASSAGSLPRFPDERPAAAAGLAPPPGPRTTPKN